MDLCWKSNVSLFNMLSRLVITFLPRSKCLLISWLQSPSAVILEPPKIKSATVSTVSPFISHEVMWLDAMILDFWMLSFKPTFSLSSVQEGGETEVRNEEWMSLRSSFSKLIKQVRQVSFHIFSFETIYFSGKSPRRMIDRFLGKKINCKVSVLGLTSLYLYHLCLGWYSGLCAMSIYPSCLCFLLGAFPGLLSVWLGSWMI